MVIALQPDGSLAASAGSRHTLAVSMGARARVLTGAMERWVLPFPAQRLHRFTAQTRNRSAHRLGKPQIPRGSRSLVLPCVRSGAAARRKAHWRPLVHSCFLDYITNPM